MKDNHGYSLMELIVVIAIMGVVIGFALLGYNSLSSQKAKTASKRIYNMLGSAQTVAMSKGNTLYGIITDDDGKITVCTFYKENGSSDYTILQSSDINKSVLVSFKNSAGNRYYIGDTSLSNEDMTYCKGVIISIDRSTGRFNGTYLYSGTVASPIGESAGTCSNIYITVGDREKDIVLVSLTGKFFFNE